MAAFLNVCRFNPTAGGTTDWTYSSAVNGYQSPAAANVVNGRLYKYRAESADLSQWELGEGVYNSGVLTRATVLFNSSGSTSKINFSTAPQVAIVALKEDLISIEEANTFTTAQQYQARANIYAAPVDALAFNNIALNANQEVSQENGATVITGITATSRHITDQNVIDCVGAVVVTGQQVTDAPPGFTYSLKCTLTTAMASPGAGDYLVMRQPIEAYRMAPLKLGTADAVSFSVGEWVKASVAGIYYAFVASQDQQRQYLNRVVLAPNTWTWVQFAAPGEIGGNWSSGSSKGCDVGWALATGSSWQLGTTSQWSTASTTWSGTDQTNWAASLTGGAGATVPTFQRTGLVFVPGSDMPTSAASRYMMKSYADNLRDCQRYVESGSFLFQAVSGVQANRAHSWVIPFKVTKRTASTPTLSGLSQTRCTGTTANSASVEKFNITTINTLADGDDFTTSGNWICKAQM
jgi:hypothetical protein